jgi:hypothetical protein
MLFILVKTIEKMAEGRRQAAERKQFKVEPNNREPAFQLVNSSTG